MESKKSKTTFAKFRGKSAAVPGQFAGKPVLEIRERSGREGGGSGQFFGTSPSGSYKDTHSMLSETPSEQVRLGRSQIGFGGRRLPPLLGHVPVTLEGHEQRLEFVGRSLRFAQPCGPVLWLDHRRHAIGLGSQQRVRLRRYHHEGEQAALAAVGPAL